jgi:hypothetical protein
VEGDVGEDVDHCCRLCFKHPMKQRVAGHRGVILLYSWAKHKGIVCIYVLYSWATHKGIHVCTHRFQLKEILLDIGGQYFQIKANQIKSNHPLLSHDQ